MQTIQIESLKIHTIIGVFDWERVIKQALVFDVMMVCDMTKAFVSDNVSDVINYQAVCEDIERICHKTKAKLLEYLAYQVMGYLFEQYPCQKITLTLKKPHAIKQADAVGVCIEFDREQYQTLIGEN